MRDGIDLSLRGPSGYEGLAASRQHRLVSREMVAVLVALADVVAVIAASAGVYSLRFRLEPPGEGSYTAATLLMGALVTVALCSGRFYQFQSITAWPRGSMGAVARIAAVALFLIVLAFAFKISQEFSRIWLVGTAAGSAALIFAVHGIAAALIRRTARAGVFRRTVAVVGATEQAARFLDRLASVAPSQAQVIGIFDDRHTRISPSVESFPLRGNLNDLIASIGRHEVDDVVITLPWNANERLANIITRLQLHPVHVYLDTELIGRRLVSRLSALADGFPMVEVARAPLSGWNGLVKALEDRLLVLIALACFMPLMGLIAVAIKLDSRGPVLFRQARYGYNNELIEVFKFRTMYHDMRDDNGEKLTMRGDTRVTRVGRFLRLTSTDELPQLFNVWNGTMSMVGPRPHPTRAKAGDRLYEEVVLEYVARHRVKPGITGWAQVNGWRGDTESEEKIRKRVEYDLYYIENMSIWLDLKILFATMFSGWVHDNAY